MDKNYADTIRAAFREEAQDLLGELETGLLLLEDSPDDRDLVGRIFRALHTIKGSGAMAGFEAIADLTHRVESLFDLVRNGKMKADKQLIDVTLSAKDVINLMLAGEEDARAAQLAEDIARRVAAISEDGPVPAAASESRSSSEQMNETQDDSKTFRIRFKPSNDIFLHGTNPLSLLAELTHLGECTIVAHTSGIPALGELNPELCYTAWDIVLTTSRGENSIRDVFIFVMDDSELKIEEVARDAHVESSVSYKKLGEILVERGDLASASLNEVLATKGPIGRTLVERGLVNAEDVESALAEQAQVKKVFEKQQAQSSSQAIRVGSDKLDGLVDLVGELVTVQASLSQSAATSRDPSVVAISEKLERLASDLRETAMGMRMVPIGSSFGKLKRLVRDLSIQLGKQAVLITNGEETELDKTVIERLGDPLVHLIRNSLDHGVESPAERKARGKNPEGAIHLTAGQSGGFVYITVSDDGAGLDVDKIRERAIERGLAAQGAQLTEKEIFELVFLPGFSTSDSLTEVSGRGVGMDVVKTTIDGLRGEVSISSEPGKGTSVRLKLPLTLAIIDGLLVAVRGERYIFPLSSVDECVEYTAPRDEADGRGKRLINVRGTLLPFISLRELFGVDGERPPIEQIVITEVDGSRIGFLVDSVVGSHQTVIKNLGTVYRRVEGFSGATILGDGTMALILDLGRLIERAEVGERKKVFGTRQERVLSPIEG